MSDEVVTPAPETPETPAAPAAPAPADDRIAGLERSVSALTDVVKSTLTQRQQAQQTPQHTPVVTDVSPQEREYLRSQGLSDQEIDYNKNIVRPFVQAGLRMVAPDILGLVGGVKDEVEVVKAERNTKEYPHWDLVGDKVRELRADAQKAGQYLDVRRAYEAAVALNVDKIVESTNQRRAQSAAADATAQHVRNVGGRGGGTAGPKTVQDVRAMSREDRKKYFESIGNLPIQ